MTVPAEVLGALAFSRAPARQANEAIEAVRQARGPGALSYEVVAGPDGALAPSLLEKLVYFLDCRGVRPPLGLERGGGVFLTVFSADGLCFVEAGAALEVLSSAQGLTVEEAFRRHGQGAPPPGPPPALLP